jgi:flagellar biosynthesis protein FlhG
LANHPLRERLSTRVIVVEFVSTGDPAQRQTIRLVVNQAARLGDGRAITTQLQQVLDRFVHSEPGRQLRLIHMGDIPADPQVRQAIMRRQLLLQSMPGSPAGMAISQLALKLQEAVMR